MSIDAFVPSINQSIRPTQLTDVAHELPVQVLGLSREGQGDRAELVVHGGLVSHVHLWIVCAMREQGSAVARRMGLDQDRFEWRHLLLRHPALGRWALWIPRQFHPNPVARVGASAKPTPVRPTPHSRCSRRKCRPPRPSMIARVRPDPSSTSKQQNRSIRSLTRPWVRAIWGAGARKAVAVPTRVARVSSFILKWCRVRRDLWIVAGIRAEGSDRVPAQGKRLGREESVPLPPRFRLLGFLGDWGRTASKPDSTLIGNVWVDREEEAEAGHPRRGGAL